MTELHDDDKLQRPGDVGNWQTVKDLRSLGYTEPELESIADFGAIERRGEWYTVAELRLAAGRRHSTADQEHLDVAATHAAAVLDKLHSAGARVPGTSQQREADIETEERNAEGFAPPDIYAGPLAIMRAASLRSSTSFEDTWKAQRAAEFAAQRDRMARHVDAHPSAPRLTTAEVKSYAPPDAYAADLAKMRNR